jgi:AAA15 family ATPase/GTPase
MIVDFTVANFRSIRERQTFSLFAESSSAKLASNIAYPSSENIGVLRTAGVYGANASGKSNLLIAFWALRYLVCGSGDLKDGDTIPCYEPYKLDKHTKASPIDFEIEFFSKEKLRFIYSISFDANRIISESLDFYPSRSRANLFRREKGDSWEDVSFGAHYKGGKKKYAFFPNNSYISKAGNSADAPDLIRSIFNYFRNDLFHLGADEKVGILDWKEDNSIVNSIASILCKVDTGISGIQFRDSDISKIDLPKSIPEALRKRILENESKKPVFLHKGKNGYEEEFGEDMESSGTLKLFNILPMLLNAFKDGGVLVIDELDNSFHPHIAELIIKLFNDESVNRNNAQLIFSTHNISLMSSSLLRRDQIWLTEKRNGQTSFSSLDDFDKNVVKMDSPFSKWYSDGRFGAIPEIDVKEISRIIKGRFSDAKG